MSTPKEVAHDERTLRRWAEDALDTIDSGVFSGDTFNSTEAIARLEYYMARWQRELVIKREMLAEK